MGKKILSDSPMKRKIKQYYPYGFWSLYTFSDAESCRFTGILEQKWRTSLDSEELPIEPIKFQIYGWEDARTLCYFFPEAYLPLPFTVTTNLPGFLPASHTSIRIEDVSLRELKQTELQYMVLFILLLKKWMVNWNP